jgi:hypothetical protein
MATLFDYDIQPSQAFVATNTVLTLTITNPLGGNTVRFAGGPKGDEIDVYFPVGKDKTDLTLAIQFTATCNTPGFTCGKATAGNYFVVRAPAGASLTPGGQVVILFNPVTINSIAGQATITIKEIIGSSENDKDVSVTKLPQELGIIAWLQPWTIGANQYSTLLWQSMGGTSVQISGYAGGTGTKTFPVSGNPPYPGNTQVTVQPSEAQRTYTVAVYTSDNQHKEVPVTLTQHAPLITSYTADKSGILSVTDPVTLNWSLMFAGSSTLQTPALNKNNPNPPLVVVPGQDIAKAFQGNYPAMPDTASYLLTAYGYQVNPSETLSFKLAAVQLAYFKFSSNDNGSLSGLVYKTDPAQWPPVQLEVVSPTLNILTIFQPGQFSSVYYLGSGDTVHPQIQYFEATDNGKGEYIFNWVTANLKSLVLNPGNHQIDSSSIQSGSLTLAPTAGKYILTGTGTNGDTIVSMLDVAYPAKNSAGSSKKNRPKKTDFEINVRSTEAIHGYFKPDKINVDDLMKGVELLGYQDIWRTPPWRKVCGSVRVEVKGATSGGGRHWQVHVNGIKSEAIISEVLIQGSLAKISDSRLQQLVIECFRSEAMVGSMQTGCRMEVYIL